MAAQLQVSYGNVTGAEQFDKVNVQVRNNTLTIRTRGTGALLAQEPGVVSVTKTQRNRWTVTLGDERVYEITKARGCGCGR